MKIYIACGLTHVPRDFFDTYTNFIHTLAHYFKKREHIVKYALVDSDPQLAKKPFEERAPLCYYWDRNMVEEADVIIAEASYPSTGLGIELQIAANNEIPIILCFQDDKQLQAHPIEYENPDHKKYTLQVGEGYVSLMALGLPNIYKVIKYHPHNGIDKISESIELLTKSN